MKFAHNSWLKASGGHLRAFKYYQVFDAEIIGSWKKIFFDKSLSFCGAEKPLPVTNFTCRIPMGIPLWNFRISEFSEKIRKFSQFAPLPWFLITFKSLSFWGAEKPFPLTNFPRLFPRGVPLWNLVFLRNFWYLKKKKRVRYFRIKSSLGKGGGVGWFRMFILILNGRCTKSSGDFVGIYS